LARLDESIAAFNQRFILNLWNQGNNTVKVIKISSKLFLFILMPLGFCEKRENFLHGHQKPDGE
jgi:hypothetical protein